MCGTVMQIGGMAFGLYLVDMMISPLTFGRSEFADVFMFLLKGAVEYWIYKWFQCKPDGSYSRNALAGLSFMNILMGGLVGGVTLFFAGQLVNEGRANDFGSILVKYGIEAVILNFVYGATGNMIAGMGTPVPPVA